MPAPGPPVPPLLGQTEQSIGEATCFLRGRQPRPPVLGGAPLPPRGPVPSLPPPSPVGPECRLGWWDMT